MPPFPSGSRISKLPRRLPGCRAMDSRERFYALRESRALRLDDDAGVAPLPVENLVVLVAAVGRVLLRGARRARLLGVIAEQSPLGQALRVVSHEGHVLEGPRRALRHVDDDGQGLAPAGLEHDLVTLLPTDDRKGNGLPVFLDVAGVGPDG